MLPGPRGGSPDGRWPANLILTDPVLDGGWEGVEGAGMATTGGSITTAKQGFAQDSYMGGGSGTGGFTSYGDKGTYSRFFMVAKPSRRERGASTHPTMKPVTLMRHLVRLVTPPGGLVLDPFLGSGTTGLACEAEGMRWVGIERDESYAAQAEARISRGLVVIPLRKKVETKEAPAMTGWYCTYCGEQHQPDMGTLIDARYATGMCGKSLRQLVRDEATAIRLAESVGKLRPKGVPLGGGQRKPQQIGVADAAKTKAIQEGQA